MIGYLALSIYYLYCIAEKLSHAKKGFYQTIIEVFMREVEGV